MARLVAIALLSAAFLGFIAAPVQAQGGSALGVKHHFDWSKKLQAQSELEALDHTLLGDQIDLQSGALTFQQVDVSLPGNSGLEVSVHRTRAHGRESIFGGFKDWTLDVPVIRTNIPSSQWSATNGRWGKQRCSLPLVSSIPYQHRVAQQDGFTESRTYNHGVIMDIPGRGVQQILDNPDGASWPSTAKKVTAEGWYLTCISNVDGAGTEGFYAFAPNGDRYKFDKVASRRYVSKIETWFAWMDFGNRFYTYFSDYMSYDMLAATEVVDVHGNWVKYTYDNDGRLTKIDSNDGRRIDLLYSGTEGWVSHVVANPGTADARTWTYQYGVKSVLERNTESANPSPTNKYYNYSMLTAVTLPDGRSWTYDLGGMNAESVPGTNLCKQLAQTVSVAHPNGVTGTFSLEEQTLELGEQSPNAGASCPHTESGAHPSSRYTDQMVVVEKTLSGANIPTATWQYAYIPKWSSALENWTEVIRPDGARIRSVFKSPHAGYLSGGVPVVLGGVLLREEIFATASSATPIQKQIYSYDYESPVGSSYAVSVADKASAPTRRATVRTERGSDWYETDWTYALNRNASGYSYGFPTQIVQTSSDVALSRTELIEYEHNTTKWLLGLPKKFTRNGKEFEANTFNSVNGNLMTSRKFGETTGLTFTYNGDGTVSSVTDALGRVRQFSLHKRGIPQLIKEAVGTPDEITISATVDNNGWIKSFTNPRGITFSYTYNSVGWLTSINRPGAWADTSISYSGLGSGIVQTQTRGSLRTITTYDEFYRPILVRQQALSGGGGSIYAKTSYNALGQTVFEAWPSTSSNPADGVSTSYDALGRVTQTQETVYPSATTSYEYLTGNKIRVTDPANAQTTTTYRAFGAPATDEVMSVVDPMGATTSFQRDIYGNVTQMDQSGTQNGYTASVTRNFWYDDRLRLCQHYAPEFGYERFAYDQVDQLVQASRAEAAGGGAACPSVTWSLRTSYTYDNLGRQTFIDFPGSTPDIARAYDANGNVTDVDRGGISWDYAYNELDLLNVETLSIDGRTYSLTHGYEPSGNVANRILPDGMVIDFDVDGHGRPTTVRTQSWRYVDAITYHPNGLPASAVYKNGYSFSQTLDARQLPYDIDVYGGSAGNVLDLRYGYDARRKVTSITDYAVAGQNRSFGYDPAGRLETAAGPWGTGSFKYDALNNIRQKQLGSRTVSIGYDTATNRVSQVTDSAGGGAQAWAYDARGNVTGNGANTLTYDTANQPTAVTAPGLSEVHTYDGNLKRVKTVRNGQTTYWVYSALTGGLAHQDDVTANKQTDYLSGGGVTVRRQGNAYYFDHLDAQGSAMVQTDHYNGSVVWRELYTPFGEKTVDAPANRDDVGYTGHVQDDLSGLTYMQARYYDPVSGRFLSTDPIGYQDQFNLYAYAYNDPTNRIDPTGEDSIHRDKYIENAQKHRGEASGLEKAIVSTIADFVPGVGDVKGIAEAVADPSFANVAAAIVGLAPGVGDVAAKGIKTGSNVVEKASTLGRGPFAKESISAQPGRPTASQQRQINEIGDSNGCHTCGANEPGTQTGNWVGDHQPPTAINKSNSPQEFLPHCIDCMRRQGGEVLRELRNIEK